MDKAKCKVCSKISPRIRSEKKFNKKSGYFYIYRNTLGSPWAGRRCPECNMEYMTTNARRKGTLPIDGVAAHNIRKGRESEVIAAKQFRNLGFDVELTKINGPDLTLYYKGKKIFTVEVKSVVRHQNNRCCVVQKVQRNRKKDDLIAYVWPSGKVQVLSMKSHLKKCPPSGRRTVTKFLNKYEGV